MRKYEVLLEDIRSGVEGILELPGRRENGANFIGGLREDLPLRHTQWEALLAYKDFLERKDLSSKEKLSGYFEIPTGVGKTAMFIGIAHAAHKRAAAQHRIFQTVIVVPTIELLSQTKEEFVFYAPEMVDKIGLYWEQEKDLSKPITVITYDSWNEVVNDGKLNSNNVDLLISDEGHRGTSEKREDHILSSFSGSTVKLAFTATATFDLQKSVENTHKHRIYYKNIADAVSEGELADYIQLYFYIIRAEPQSLTLGHEFSEVIRNSNYSPRYELRKAAWSDWAVKAFEQEIDNETGDLISENQAGFFVADTAHADKLEQQLNSNVALQKMAERLGKKGVAVAVHSNMSRSLQVQRIREYKNSEWMAIIGDEKFKEGFDHPPMKTLLDFPHGSLVDKTQIMGRGARQWWNKEKNRYEGMTFLDTVVYIGSDDAEEDMRLRQEALKNAVISFDILNNSLVLSPGRRSVNIKGPSGPRPLITFDNVEQFTTLEGVETFIRERDVAQSGGRVTLTEEMLLDLQLEMERTTIRPKRLVSLHNDVPSGFNSDFIYSWLSKEAKTATAIHWNWVIDKYAALPTLNPRIKITDEMRKILQSEVDRTAVGFKAILKDAEDVPEGLRGQLTDNWRRGQVKTANPVFWNYVMERYAALPTMSEKIEITQDMRNFINSEFQRTGLGPHGLLARHIETVPHRLTPTIIYGWMRSARNVFKDHWEWVLEKYSDKPNAKLVSEQDRKNLSAHIKRTTITPGVLIKAFQDAPVDLKSVAIKSWQSGKTTLVLEAHWEWVMGKYASLPDNAKLILDNEKSKKRQEKDAKVELKKDYIAVTEAMKNFLANEVMRTGIGFSKFSKIMTVPEEFGRIQSTLESLKSGNRKSVKKEIWEWIANAYKELPDEIRTLKITEEMRGHLTSEMKRTQIGSQGLRASFGKFPKGLTVPKISAWLTGNSTIAQPNHWEWVLNRYSELPDKIKITDEHRAYFDREVQRTGIGAHILISRAQDIPEGLSANKISSLRSRNIHYIQKNYLEWIFKEYSLLPNASPRIDVTPEMASFLGSEMDRTGHGAAKLLSASSNIPDDLKENIIAGWRKGNIKSTRIDHWSWVIENYRNLPTVPHKIEITASMRSALRSEKNRTGVGYKKILSNVLDAPEGFSDQIPPSWEEGSVKAARSDYWNWLMQTYASLPTQITIKNRDRQKLIGEIERTGIAPARLLKESTDTPKGLTEAIIDTWKTGWVKNATEDRWSWVIERYASMPDKTPRIQITESMRRLLDAEMIRTGYGATRIIKAGNDKPEGLRAGNIAAWRMGTTISAEEKSWNWVMERYALLETVTPKIPFSEKLRQNLLVEHKRTGVSASSLISLSKHTPDGLTPPVAYNLVAGNVKTVNPEHVDWMMTRYSSLPDANQLSLK